MESPYKDEKDFLIERLEGERDAAQAAMGAVLRAFTALVYHSGGKVTIPAGLIERGHEMTLSRSKDADGNPVFTAWATQHEEIKIPDEVVAPQAAG